MDDKNSRESSKIESLSSPSSPKREDLKLEKKLKEPLSNSYRCQGVKERRITFFSYKLKICQSRGR